MKFKSKYCPNQIQPKQISINYNGNSFIFYFNILQFNQVIISEYTIYRAFVRQSITLAKPLIIECSINTGDILISQSELINFRANFKFIIFASTTMKLHRNKKQSQQEAQQEVQQQEDNQDQSLNAAQYQQDEQQNQQQQMMQMEEANEGQNEEENNLEDYKNRQNNRGVCYLSRIPPYMKPNYIKKLLKSYLVERVYLLAESEWSRKNRIKRGGNKKICFREGWVEFADKRMAKLAALTLNGQKMVSKKGNFYSEDLWNIKYLPKFKWHHLTERLAHQERLKKERLKIELEQEKKIDEFYSEKLIKSKTINGIVEAKKKRGKGEQRFEMREFQQYKLASEIKDQ